MDKDLVIIGGGPAGLAAAISVFDAGVKDILIIEREPTLGGILRQCIHNGFGLTRFGDNMTGPEYAERFINEVSKRKIKTLLNTTVLNLSENKIVTVTNAESGIFDIKARAVILAMGCRERSKGALNIGGFRPAGLFSAGTAQKYINIIGEGIGKDIFILGSGDIGLIMARRMTLEGAKVHGVCEIMPYSGGLRRNIVQCLDDFNIPLYLSHTIVEIHGKKRVEGVTIARVDENRKPIKSTMRRINCDTVLFSVGLIPENELSVKANVLINSKTRGAVVDDCRETSVDGVFSCGNVLHVHDLVDFVSEEAEIAGRAAAVYIQKGSNAKRYINVNPTDNVMYVVPQRINIETAESVKLFFRPSANLKNVTVKVSDKSGVKLFSKKRLAVAPGEMETIVLTREKLAGLNGDIYVAIERE